LAGGQTVNLVVHDDVKQIDVAAHGVNEVIAADAEAVSISPGYDHSQPVVSELHACGHSQGAAVERVHTVGIDVAGEVRGTADAADGNDIVQGNLQLYQSLLNGGEDAVIAAAGTPVRIGFAFRIGDRQCAGTLYE